MKILSCIVFALVAVFAVSGNASAQGCVVIRFQRQSAYTYSQIAVANGYSPVYYGHASKAGLLSR